MFLSEAPNGWHVLNVIPEFSDERNERTSHAKPPDDEEHDDLLGLESRVGAPQSGRQSIYPQNPSQRPLKVK